MYLAHHGILGQKWGIRRYQNYDGSYTQAGMKRYNKSLDEYNKKDASYKEAKAAYKSGTGTEADMVNKKLARKQAKRQLDKDYKHLKQDKLGDKGKKIYASGHTIGSDAELTQKGTILAANVALGAEYLQRNGIITTKTARAVQAGAAVATGAMWVKQAVDYDRARKLRAYYGHSSKY